jgi:ATP-binding cassette, subfamily C, bacterial CydD
VGRMGGTPQTAADGAHAADARLRARHLRDAARRAKRPLALAVLAGLGAAAATALQAYVVALTVDQGGLQRRPVQQLIPWLVVLAGAVLLKAACTDTGERAGAAAARAVQRHLRIRLIEALFVPARVAETSFAPRAGYHVQTVIEQVDRVGPYVARYLPRTHLAVLAPALFLAMIFPFNWVAGVILLCATPLIPLYMALVGMDAEARSSRQLRVVRFLSAYFLDRLQGLSTLKSLGAAEGEVARIGTTSEALGRRSMEVLGVALLSSAVLEFFSTFAIATVAVYVGFSLLGYVHFGVGREGMSLQVGLFVLLLAPAYFQPLRALAAAYHDRADALAAAEHLVPLLQADEPGVEPVQSSAPHRDSPTAIGNVSLRNVTVRFAGHDRPALRDVTLVVRPGEMVAVTGPSGAGKSTLLAALGGLVRPSSGSINIDGQTLDADPNTLLAACCWLGQRPYLFPGSIADNIRLARPEASPVMIHAAGASAGVLDFANGRTGGLDSLVGERGRQLSRGQAQRVALARALLKNAPLLLLDEPTAHLDAITEGELIQSIVSLAGRKTIVVATHSPAVIACCGRVLRLEEGVVVADSASPRQVSEPEGTRVHDA